MHPSWTLAMAMLLAAAHPAPAQVTVRADRDLDFGFVTAGIAKSTTPEDPVSSAQWTLTVSNGSHIKVDLVLPTSLRNPTSGTTLAISFATTDAFLQETGGPVRTFNPNGTLNYKMTVSNTAILRLGGRVLPTAGQSGGRYESSVVITINLLN